MTIQETLDYIHSVCWKGSVPGLFPSLTPPHLTTQHYLAVGSEAT